MKFPSSAMASLACLIRLALSLICLHISTIAHADVFLWPQPQSITWASGPPIPLSSSFQFRLPPSSPAELRGAATRYRDLIFEEKWVPVQVAPPPRSSVMPPTKAGANVPITPLQHLTETVSDLGVATRYRDLISPVQVAPPAQSKGKAGANEAITGPLQYLTVTVSDLGADLQQGVKEGYKLVVPDAGGGDGASLTADTVWGALHGLETFSQLVRYDETARELVVEKEVTVSDEPLFGYRAIMLDVARNFFPLSDLMRTVYNKLNVLHLHLTDSQSFPLELPSEPELARKGSYGPEFVYSAQDIRHLVSYARSYGVRIVPEIDMPGHSGSWAGAYLDLVTCYDKFWLPDMAVEPVPGQLNPLKNATYDVVKNVINDVATTFPDGFFHGGNDEPMPGCWKSSLDIAEYLEIEGHTLSALMEKFVGETHPYITGLNKTAIYWEDILLSTDISVRPLFIPPQTTILTTWNGGPLNTKRLTTAGYRTIVASADFYYLDCGRGSFVGNDTAVDDMVDPSPGHPSYNYGGSGGSWCAPYKSWQRIYDYDITTNLTHAEAQLVIGGQVSLWSEQADPTVLDSLLWPRASALAESLWSGNRDSTTGLRRSVDALYRLSDWRYRMVSRGISAMPLQPHWCLKHPGECNFA